MFSLLPSLRNEEAGNTSLSAMWSHVISRQGRDGYLRSGEVGNLLPEGLHLPGHLVALLAEPAHVLGHLPHQLLCVQVLLLLLFGLLGLLPRLSQELLEALVVQHARRQVRLTLGLQVLELLPQAPEGLQLIVEATLPGQGGLQVQLQVQGGPHGALGRCPPEDRLAHRPLDSQTSPFGGVPHKQ